MEEQNASPTPLVPMKDSERIMVLGIETLLKSDLAIKLGSSIEKFAEAQLKESEVELKSIELEGKEIELQKMQIESFDKIDIRYRFDRYFKFILITILLFILNSFDIIDISAFRAILLTAIGFFINDNWSDVNKFFSKKKD